MRYQGIHQLNTELNFPFCVNTENFRHNLSLCMFKPGTTITIHKQKNTAIEHHRESTLAAHRIPILLSLFIKFRSRWLESESTGQHTLKGMYTAAIFSVIL